MVVVEVCQELRRERLRMSQYMALTHQTQFTHLLNGDNNISAMASPWRGPPQTALQAIWKGETVKSSFQLRCLSTVVPLCLRAETRAASHT